MHKNAVTDTFLRFPPEYNGLNYQIIYQTACPTAFSLREAVWGLPETRSGRLTALSGVCGGVRHEQIFRFGHVLVLLDRFFLCQSGICV